MNGSLYPTLSTSTVQAHAPSLSQIFQWGERHPPNGSCLGGIEILLTASAALPLMGWALTLSFSSSAAAGITATVLTGVPLLLLILLHVTSSSSITGASVETPPCASGGLRVALLRGLIAVS